MTAPAPRPLLDDDALIAAFEGGTLQAGQFGHGDHVRIGYLYLRRYGFLAATERLARNLKALVTRLGVPEKYNETITVAFMALINERLDAGGDCGGWSAFAARNPDLLSMEILGRYYPADLLKSERARRVFVLAEPA
jgi:hypothetical protein